MFEILVFEVSIVHLFCLLGIDWTIDAFSKIGVILLTISVRIRKLRVRSIVRVIHDVEPHATC